MASISLSEDLLRKHKQEQRDLQARITQKKKNATKKTRKGINDECSALEKELYDRQTAELRSIDGTPAEEDAIDEQRIDDELLDKQVSMNGMLTDDGAGESNVTTDRNSLAPKYQSSTLPGAKPKKPNRQKARLARRAADQASSTARAEDEASSLPDRRAEERAAMTEEFNSRGLEEKDVRSDGHCLYAAIADQVQHRNISIGHETCPDYKIIRCDAARFIEEHPDDFAAFLEEPLDSYVSKVRNTGEWGGQLELMALAQAYGITINIVQGNRRHERIQPAEKESIQEIWLAYYRHSFGLGEHYNSLRSKS